MTTNVTHPNDLLDALLARDMGKPGYGMSSDEAFNELIDYGLSLGESREWAAQQRNLREKGKAYFAQGYRLVKTYRQMRGLSFAVPEEAIDYRVESAGYIATTEAERLVYVVKH